MAETTGISWCDSTFNPWIGCSKVHVGCLRCYAEADMGIRRKRVKWGPNGTRSKTSDANWKLPLKWNKVAAKGVPVFTKPTGELVTMPVRPRVFCASLADVFEDWDGEIRDHRGGILHRCRAGHLIAGDAVYANGMECDSGCNRAAHPITMDDLRADLFALIDATPNLDWLLLTKRPENIRRMWTNRALTDAPHHAGGVIQTASRPNVWLLTSVSDQETADKMIPELLQCRDLVPVLGVSYEPALGPVDFCSIRRADGWDIDTLRGAYSRHHDEGVDHPAAMEEHGGGPHLDWVIIGGESGPNARPCRESWFRNTIKQCADAGVACFVKQLGRYCFPAWMDELAGVFGGGGRSEIVGKSTFKDPKGGDPSEWPEQDRVRQFPEANHAD